MNSLITLWGRITGILSGRIVESIALLFARIALAYPFWTSGRTKVVDGSLLGIDDTQYFIFADVFSGLPLSPNIAVPMTVYAEFFFPILLVLGLFSRFSAAALFIMTMVIQIFVFPDAWWTVHAFWAALALIIISRGPGAISLDQLLGMFAKPKAA